MKTIRARLALLNVGVIVLVLLLLGGIAYAMARSSLLSSLDRLLIERADRFIRRPDPLGNPGPPIPSDRMRVFDLENRPMGRLEDVPFDPAPIKMAPQKGPSFSTVTLNGDVLRVYTAPIIRPNGPLHVLQVSEPLEPTYRAVGVLTSALLTMIPLGIILAAAGGVYLTGRALRPVREMQQTAALISRDNLGRRLAVVGDDEFAQLGATINGMLTRLESSFGQLEESLERQKRFAADASHELKTPLTVIKSNVGLALSQPRAPEQYRETLGIVDRTTTSMTALVNDLLMLARADSGALRFRMSEIDLQRLVTEAIELSQKPEMAKIEWQASAEAIPVEVDADSIRRVVVNLLSNAAQHTPANGSIEVSVAAKNGVAGIRIRDTGAGIEAEHLAHLTERFYRADSARSGGGTGLGLAICKEIVNAHRGSIAFESEPGKGTTVTVTLPRKPEIVG